MHDARVSRCDLHVHSKYSDLPSEWFLRRVGAPESFVEPLELYRAALQKGMDFVTISDHNCIRGAGTRPSAGHVPLLLFQPGEKPLKFRRV